MTDDALIERVAERIRRPNGGWISYEHVARAALAAIREAGYAVVKQEPDRA